MDPHIGAAVLDSHDYRELDLECERVGFELNFARRGTRAARTNFRSTRLHPRDLRANKRVFLLTTFERQSWKLMEVSPLDLSPSIGTTIFMDDSILNIRTVV